MLIISSRLGRVWSSPNIVVGLAHLSQLLKAVPRRQPCTRRTGSGCKIKHYSSTVFIIQVLVVLQPVLAITQAIVYTYSIWLSFKYQAERLGFKKYLNQYQTFNNSGTKQTSFLSFNKASQPVILVLGTRVVQSSIILLFYSYTDSPSLEISFTVGALYIVLGTRLNSAKYLYRASLLLLVIPYGRQYLEQQSKLKWILNSLKLGQNLCFQS